ncbi:MAG TPA: sigma-54 dependent transcriptional regulator [Planctomycetota bacterium]|nr:sigma-54 dependent transcriptional regulator [Planctomycetota bacterium]HRR78801.1 sigma-54 dependent transcriptional regulator [Planctomycetota bacterium]HRT94936.1 sigma-54 dependent transcriptional regulator [Planctomycetota bacterium]
MGVERVLVAGPEGPRRALLTELLARHGCRVAVAENGAEAQRLLVREGADLVFADVAREDAWGPKGLPAAAREVTRDTPLIVLGPEADGGWLAAARRAGAFGCVAGPLSPESIAHWLARAGAWRERLAARPARPAPPERDAELVGRHPRLVEVVATVGRAAASKATLLVQGESGTGKELIAQLAHRGGPRARGPFVKVNCAALSETLLESELFGHERGAFTGALALRRGRFELAHGGTLLLDEVSEIPLHLQAKLLRAIEEEEFERVGGNETVRVDVRLVCTTNRDLPREVAEGRFRGDLYHRLNVVLVVLPPLRERREDIPLLVSHFLRRFRRECDSPVRAVAREAMEILKRHPWPGNVRELRNIIHRAVVLGAGEVLGPGDLPADVVEGRCVAASGGLAAGRSIDEVERDLILRTLASTGGNKTEAARLLRVTPRTLRNKLGRYGAASADAGVGTA